MRWRNREYRLEPVASEPQVVEDKGLLRVVKPDANISANNMAQNPLEKLAEVWETLTPEVQAAISALIEQITSARKTE